MAFQTALPGIAAATTEMWPSVSSAMAAPWRVGLLSGNAGQRKSTPQSTKGARRAQQAVERQIPQSALPKPSPPSKVELPECLHDLPASFSSAMSPKIVGEGIKGFGIQHTLAAMPRGALSAANPITRRAYMFPAQSRQMSTSLRSKFQQPSPAFSKVPVQHEDMYGRGTTSRSILQKRSLFGSGTTSRSILAHLEETANRNPNSATSQYAFYQALTRANMPAIIVERYQTNQFASNAASEALYHRALGAMGQSDVGTNQAQTGVQAGSLSNSQLQAIGQAVAASTRGGNVAVSRGPNVGSGAKDAPLHVVVEETIGGTIFKWVKFLLYFGLFTYLSLIVVAMVIETFQTFRKVGGKSDNEAKAEHQNVRFSDVHGCDEAKEELQELVDFLKNPDKFSTLGGKLPKGVLLVGPPGTGKTLLARAVAGEAGVPFFFMSGSEFDEVYVGVGAKRVRELFSAAKSKSPAIVFIDELDAIGGKRNARDAAYVKQTLNQLLTELDGFEQNSGVIILAATNFPEMLDKALTRPGRFDRNVVVGLPDARGRMAILQHHMKKITAAKDVSLETLAAGTPGFSGAELENVINQAAVRASKAKAQAVSMLDFEWAKDKVMMGAEKRSMIITQSEKEMTAYHEAGHTLAAIYTPGSTPLHKVTILPRGAALGVTHRLPEMDKYSKGMDEYKADIDVAMGGKVAEELIYGTDKVTSGVSSDLQMATRVAYSMVTMFGMSDKLGNVDLASNHDMLSTKTKELIEDEVRRLIDEGRARITTLLQSKRRELDLLAKALVDYESLDKNEVFKVIKGEKLDKPIMPKGSIKIPDMGQGLTGPALPHVPPLPGTVDSGERKEPPAGGAIA